MTSSKTLSGECEMLLGQALDPIALPRRGYKDVLDYFIGQAESMSSYRHMYRSFSFRLY